MSYMPILVITCKYMHYVVLHDVTSFTMFTSNHIKLHVLHTITCHYISIHALHSLTYNHMCYVFLHDITCSLSPTGGDLQIDPPVAQQ